jgi:hypothetical protein
MFSSQARLETKIKKHNNTQGGTMKYTFLFCSIIILGSVAFAQEQFQKGVYALGGSISYTTSTHEEPSSYYYSSSYDQTAFSVMPTLSYFVANQLELLFGPGYVYSKASFSGEDIKETDLGLNLGLNYYIPLGKEALFLGAGGQVLWTKESYSYSSSSYYSSSSDPSFSPPTSTYYFIGGAEIFIAQTTSIEPSIKYGRTRYNENESQHGFIFGIGVKYFIL